MIGTLWAAAALLLLGPTLLRGLPVEPGAGTAAFAGRLREDHPPGSPVDDLVDALLRAGFEVRAGEFARLSRLEGACVLGWEVFWSTEEGRVGDLDAHQTLDCPEEAP